MKQLNFILAILCLTLFSINAQNVAINDDNSNADANAILDVKSTTKGILIPRMTRSERETLGNSTPTTGLLVFDTNSESFWFKVSGGDGTKWAALGVPPGTIVAFGGSVSEIPPGYLLCDGSSINKNTYPDLHDAIGSSWGGDSNPNFNLPNLQGQFLRGVDNSEGVDPDANSRTLLYPGGNTGDNVGSYQPDQLDSHQHLLPEGTNGTVGAPYGSSNDITNDIYVASIGNALANHPKVKATGGNETRPKNAYVHYIIKY